MTIDALQPPDRSVGFHSVCQNGYTLGIASAATLEADIKQMAVDDIEADFLRADPLSLKDVMFVHYFFVPFLENCSFLLYNMTKFQNISNDYERL